MSSIKLFDVSHALYKTILHLTGADTSQDLYDTAFRLNSLLRKFSGGMCVCVRLNQNFTPRVCIIFSWSELKLLNTELFKLLQALEFQ